MTNRIVSEIEYNIPSTLEEAILIASQNTQRCKFIAGGTDIMPNKFQGNDITNHLIDISKIKELKGIRKDNNYLYIGALTRLDDLKKSIKLLNLWMQTMV